MFRGDNRFSNYCARVVIVALVFIATLLPQSVFAATVIFLTSGTTWVVPADWNSSNNKIEVIGGGGAGSAVANGVGGAASCAGGGGGAYAKVTNLSLTPGANVSYSVGATGAAGSVTAIAGFNASAGNPTFFNGTQGSGNNSVQAGGGGGGSFTGSSGVTATGGLGGVVINGSGFSGGAGGDAITPGADLPASAGGGGAAGPNGAGNAAGNQSGVGQTGGGSGDNGSGGAGGGAASNGGSGTEWTTAGSGGGGGAQSAYGGNLVGGSGGSYGGGGAGACKISNDGLSATSGAGAQGIIVITYSASLTCTAPCLTFSDTVSVAAGTSVTGALAKGSGTFVIDHPLNPLNMLLYHSFVESPDVMNLYDGIATLDDNGEVTIELPSYFMALNREFRYLATPLGSPMPNLYISGEVKKKWLGLFGDIVFSIAGGVRNGRVSWQVTGIRHDPLIEQNPIIPEVRKGPKALINVGVCLFAPLCR